MTRAVLEGVSFGLRDSLEALKTTAVDVKSLIAIGGGSASNYWLKLLATVLNLSLELPKGREFGAALGAARLGMIAETGAEPADIMIAPEAHDIIKPQEDLVNAYDIAYHRFTDSYSGLKNIQ